MSVVLIVYLYLLFDYDKIFKYLLQHSTSINSVCASHFRRSYVFFRNVLFSGETYIIFPE